MPREINDKIDALFVEGPDDGAVVNSVVRKLVGIDLARRPHRIVRANDEGEWTIPLPPAVATR